MFPVVFCCKTGGKDENAKHSNKHADVNRCCTAIAVECSPGYYVSGNSCMDCGNGYYCPDGINRISCRDTVKPGSPEPNAIQSISNGSWADNNHAVSEWDCVCDWEFEDETRIKYLNEGACPTGPWEPDYTYYYWCRTGYYANDPLHRGDWYSSCSPCTNGPENSIYTGYSTPSVMYAVESNCPWQCNAGYYRDGNICMGCPETHPNSAAGSDNINHCYAICNNNKIAYYDNNCTYPIECTQGYYLPANSHQCTQCPKNSYCPGGIFNPTNTDSGITQCPDNTTSLPGLDSADDCGRILHIGEYVLYLRTAKLTSPALHVKIGDVIYYGDMFPA